MITCIEELSLRALPPFETEVYDGWVPRFADGYTKRANSVNPVSCPIGGFFGILVQISQRQVVRLKDRLNQIRESHDTGIARKQKAVRLLSVLLAGLAFGFLAKLTDGIQGLEDIGTYFGLWILAVTILAAWSRSPRAAAVHVPVFLLAMVLAYYLYSMMLFGSFYRSYFLQWSIIALLSPMAGFILWYARGRGWIAALCAALPIGALLAEGFRFVYVLPLHMVQFCFDLGAAVLLYVILPKGEMQHVRALPFVILIVLLSRLIRLPII